jgi:two-component system chemotaxis sensor kinase CheA
VHDLIKSTGDIVETSKAVLGAESIHLVASAYEKLLSSIQGQGNVYPHGVIQVLVQGVEVIKTLAADFAQVRDRVVNLKPVIDALGRWTESSTEGELEDVTANDTLFEAEVRVDEEQPEFLGVDEAVISGYLSQYRLNEAALARYAAQQATDYNSAHLVVTDENLNTMRALAGELLVVKNAYNATMQSLLLRSLGDTQHQQIEEMRQSLDLIAEKIQSQVLDVRKIPLRDVFYHFPEMVKKMSLDSGKAVSLEMSGLDFGVDKSIADLIAAVTTRLIWSSLTFGIEDIDARIKKSKSVSGDIRIHASQLSDMVSISVSDDGYGIDPEQIKKRATDLGIITKDEAYLMQPKDAMSLLFIPEISRRRALADDAGIVYGLEKLKTDLEHRGGHCSVESSFGMGTRITVEIPVTQTVRTEHALLAESGGCQLIVPMCSVVKITPIKDLILSKVDGRMTCQYEGVTIPLGDFRHFVDKESKQNFIDRSDFSPESIVLVVSDEEHSLALVVDEVVDQMDAVVQPFDSVIDGLVGFRGTTLLDSERVAFVVDPETLLGAAYAA